MTRYINIRLLTVGVDAGPFNIYLNYDNFANPVRENVSVQSLSAGYILEVDQPATQIRVRSLGLCTNYVDTIIPCPIV